jgi:hypothetical protein
MGFEPTTFCAWQAVAPLADRSEYGDFECPHSRQAFGAIERLERQRAEVMVRRCSGRPVQRDNSLCLTPSRSVTVYG